MRLFLNELKKGFKDSAYLAYCADTYLLYEAKLMIKKTVPPDVMDFAFEGFDAGGDGFSPEAVIDALRSVPFMGGRKTVVLDNLDQMKAAPLKKIKAYAEKPERHSLLFMLSASKKPPEGFSENVKTVPLLLGDRDLPLWIRKKAKDEGFELSEEVVAFLRENYAQEPGLIASEIKKLALAGKPVVEIGDLKGLMENMTAHNAFDLIRALTERDYDRAFRLSREFKSQMELAMLLGALNKMYSRRNLSPDKEEKVMDILRQADIRARALSGAYPVEDLLVRLIRI
ncbi:MAG: hypothetical protein M0Z59_08695 [Nitrospiraceae bacterium]|nr:hypothetical protein [Nitrospiraceae bacterium]